MIILSISGNNLVISCQGKTDYSVSHDKENLTHKIRLKHLRDIEAESDTVTTREGLDALWAKVEALCKEDFKEKVEAFHPNVTVNPVSGKYYLRFNNNAISNTEIPTPLVEMMQKSIEKELSIDPIIKNWVRFLRNPKMRKPGPVADLFKKRYVDYITSIYVRPDLLKQYQDEGLSYEVAKEKASVYEISITKQGFITGYKVSAEIDHKFEKDANGNIVKVARYATSFDENTGEIIEFDKSTLDIEDRLFEPYMQHQSGDAFYCRSVGGKGKGFGDKLGHFIRVGCVITLPEWSMVNCDDNSVCVKGLHCGNLSYLTGWNDGVLHTVLVDPMNIGAIPYYNGNNAIRVKEYYVNGSFSIPTNAIYHESEYGKLTEAQWTEMLKELKEENTKLQDETISTVAATQDELNGLSI